MIDKIYKISKMGHIIRSGIILSRETCVDELNKISQLEADLSKEKKQNRYLRSSLNRICSDASNGEHIDKDWIRDVLECEPSLLIIDALSNKAHKLEADLKAKDKEIERKGKLLTRVLNRCSHWLGDELFKDIFNELKLRDENA